MRDVHILVQWVLDTIECLTVKLLQADDDLVRKMKDAAEKHVQKVGSSEMRTILSFWKRSSFK